MMTGPCLSNCRLGNEWEAQRGELDKMFERLSEAQLAKLPRYDMPKLMSNVHLFDHQKDAIRWLIHQERNSLPDYFEETANHFSRKVWKCKITKTSQTHRPVPVRGGV